MLPETDSCWGNHMQRYPVPSATGGAPIGMGSPRQGQVGTSSLARERHYTAQLIFMGSCGFNCFVEASGCIYRSNVRDAENKDTPRGAAAGWWDSNPLNSPLILEQKHLPRHLCNPGIQT